MADRPNIVVLTVDSLRADHLACYGYQRPTSPFMDSLAASGVLAEQFIAPGIPTHVSYTNMLTGQFPITHNIVAHSGKVDLARDTPHIAELLLEQGYTTCTVDNLWRQRYWYARGFEYVIDPSVGRALLIAVTSEELNRRAIPWIREHRDEPFFLFMHYWDPHYPYFPPERHRHLFYEGNPINPDDHSLDGYWDQPTGMLAQDTWLNTPDGYVTDARYVAALYDQEIRHIDDGLRAVVETIDDLGLSDRTLIIVVGDHGESMTEHGIFFDHFGLHDQVLRVPMIMRLPGQLPAGRRMPRMLQHVDLAPTILEAAGVPIPREIDGRSFWKLATGATDEGGYDAVISEECTFQASWSIRTDEYKFIVPRSPNVYGTMDRELYDLKADPAEAHNIITERPEIASALEARLEEWIAEHLRKAGRSSDPLIEQGPSMPASRFLVAD